jgi:Bax protein
MHKPGQSPRPGYVYAMLMSVLFASAFIIESPKPVAELFAPLPEDSLVDVILMAEMPDFAAIRDVDEKKQAFFNFLQPYIDAKNAQIQQQRLQLLGLIEKMAVGYVLSHHEVGFLYDLSSEYEAPTDDIRNPTFLEFLLRRVDVIPPSLVLAQAANESAWGTSRFAQEGYNFFGQWCYTPGCGLVPTRRRTSASHEVKSFSSIEEAVNAYFLNINTFPSYQYLRLLRRELRRNAQPIDSLTLVEGLGSYSERGDAYILELRSMIHFNELKHRDRQIIH